MAQEANSHGQSSFPGILMRADIDGSLGPATYPPTNSRAGILTRPCPLAGLLKMPSGQGFNGFLPYSFQQGCGEKIKQLLLMPIEFLKFR